MSEEAANDGAYVRAVTPCEASCRLCYGTGVWGKEGEPCQCRKPIAPATVRQVLARLTVEQMEFLRAYEHTLALQPVTEAEWDLRRVSYFVEEDDAVYDDDWERTILVPPTTHWFAGGQASMGPQHDGVKTWIQYNPLGLALRECLMCGAEYPSLPPAPVERTAPPP